ncbi:histidine phosphatase family protein [Paenibacillus sp. HJL G12]|uniref:Histidine phosphatase family protein n=1 Tax=Paenibacillus dendrobii TaxID=2691084 RepID=A0A7X3IJ29_9BACL|nr:histidine phosphatase family protein [Paenibacillus dendrobii]MWV44366.1 histidine phosphatase family protein [Paenibacillus dendrobii]
MDLKRIELVCMRHGSTVWNEQKRYLGHSDLSLSLHGQKELSSARDKLKEMMFDAVYCSDLARCRESLEVVRPDLMANAVYDSALREMDFGKWEGQTYDQLKDWPLYRQWLDDPQHVTPPQGETWDSFERRIAGFLKSMLQSGEQRQTETSAFSESVLLVAHGGVIRQMISCLMPGRAFWDTRIEPGQLLVLTLERRDEEWSSLEIRVV